jgi:hypothetical protein
MCMSVAQAAVLRMTGVGFTYPGTERQVLCDVNVRCNLNSRVAVLGVRRALAKPYVSLEFMGFPLCLCISHVHHPSGLLCGSDWHSLSRVRVTATTSAPICCAMHMGHVPSHRALMVR